jgi:hypothetical protein
MTVTDEDRKAAGNLLPSLTGIRSGREDAAQGDYDNHPLVQAFAAHRQAAYAAGLERAAVIADKHDTGDMTREDMEARRIAADIRAEKGQP